MFSIDPEESGEGAEENRRDLGSKEAPMLAKLVKSGDLPPLRERLPENPLVVKPAERLGTYGGTWNTALLGVADAVWMDRTPGYEGLLRWSPDFTKVVPNVAESYEGNADGTEYTIRLRRGIRWSDGEPFTAEDVVFYQSDVVNNTDLSPEGPSNLVTAEPLDEYTVRFVFESPEGLFVKRHASNSGIFARFPKHYLRQFHREYNPDVDTLVKQEKADDWVTLFGSKAGFGVGPGETYMNRTARPSTPGGPSPRSATAPAPSSSGAPITGRSIRGAGSFRTSTGSTTRSSQTPRPCC